MMPAILSHAEARAWLRALGLDYRVRLPKAGKVLYVDDPQHQGLWRVTLHTSGGYTVEPWTVEVQA